MKIARIVAPAIITAAATLMPMKFANAACEIVETPRGPQLRCSLSDLNEGRDGDLKISIDPDGPRLRLPNLVVKDIDDALLGNSVEMGIEVENRGMVSAGQFVVSVASYIENPFDGSESNTQSFPLINVPALAAGAAFSAIAGTVTLPNLSQDWDVCADVIVDWPAPFGPSSGSVLESNESDNEDGKCCRWYFDNTAPNDPGMC